jgi:hypothetical protein
MTNLPVRGSRTAPPEIDNLEEVGKAFQSDVPMQYVGREELFLDTEPYALGMIANDSRAAELTFRMVREQETWARAVGGAVEVNYDGMSVMAARNTNRAIEQTIVRHNARPLERIVTTEQQGSPFKRAYAYQTHDGGVHINMAMAENGSARSIGARAAADNARKAQQYDALASGESTKKYKALIAQHEQELTKMVADREAFIVRRQAAGQIDTRETHDFLMAFESDERVARRLIKKWKESIVEAERLHKTPAIRRIRSRQWSTAGTVPEDELTNIIVHEIGHYYHRRYGFYDPKAMEVLSRKSSKVPEGFLRHYDPETKKWDGSHLAREEAYKISEYAGTNDLEFFAEAFADYHQGGTRLSKKVKDFVKEVIETNTQFSDVDLTMSRVSPLGERKGNPKAVRTAFR